PNLARHPPHPAPSPTCPTTSCHFASPNKNGHPTTGQPPPFAKANHDHQQERTSGPKLRPTTKLHLAKREVQNRPGRRRPMAVLRPALPTQHQHRGRPPPPRTPLGALRPRHDRPPGHRRPGTPQRVLVRGRRRGHRRGPRAHFHPPRRTVETAERTQV